MPAKVPKRKMFNSESAKLNFRPSVEKSEKRGTKPTIEQTSVREVITLMVLHICKKSLFVDTNIRIAVYLGCLFGISLIADVGSIPKGYFASSNNVFNKYFVKVSWGWNLMLLIPYVLLTSYTYCCGQKDKIFKQHISRLLVATFFWSFWTYIFQFIEVHFGKCSVKGSNVKQICLKQGYIWNGFDISGHSFILIYGSLLFIEECRSLLNWDSINDHIRLEDHYRSNKETTLSNNPLRSLSDEQFKFLKKQYHKFTPIIRGLFVTITVFQILWDFMLVMTMLYFHTMVEKFIGGLIAIFTWYFTYRLWYINSSLYPSLPGEGLFKYIKSYSTNTQSTERNRKTSLVGDRNQIPKFMGMPLYTNGNPTVSQVDDACR